MQREAAGQGGRPSPAGSAKISARILEAAQTLFLRDGFAHTSMDAVAAEIGISKRTLYARHASKAALFEAVVIDLLTANMSKIGMSDLAGLSRRDHLLTLSERILTVATDPLFIALERVVTGEAQHFPQLAGLIHQHGGSILRKEISTILGDRGASEANIGRDAEIFLSMVILPPLRRAVLQQAAPGLRGVDRAFLERTVDIFIHGIEGG